jgi:predicted Zn-dependent peptidase
VVNEALITTTLGNGLRVVSEHLPGSRSASIGAWFAVGSRDEAPERSGASHFLEHLLFKGTEERSARHVAEAIDGVGGDMNAFTAREYTAFYARVPDTSATMATDLLFDVLRRPALRSADVDAERQVINEELVAALDTPDDLVHIVLYETLFADHALGREVLGEPETIEAMSPEDIAAFHGRWYRPANLVIAAAGNVDHGDLVADVERHFGDLTEGEAPRRTPATAATGERVGTELPVEQLHAAIGWQSLPHDDPRRYALAVANQILGGSPSSRLFQSIREEQALAYTVYSSTSGYADTGSASVYAATSTDRGADLLTALDAEIASLVADGVTQRELDLARSGFEGSVILGLEDSGSRMSRIATGMALRNTVLPIDAFLDALGAVTVADVNDVIQTVYGAAPTVSLVGPGRALAACGV